MLKETKTDLTILFCHIFIIGSISIGGARAPWAPPMARPMPRGAGPE